MTQPIIDKVLRNLHSTKQPVVVFLMNGFQMRGCIKAYDEGGIVLHSTEGRDNLIYRHAISTISTSEYVDFTPENK